MIQILHFTIEKTCSTMKKYYIFLALVLLFNIYLTAQYSGFEASVVIQQMTGDFTFFETENGREKLEVRNFIVYGFETGMNFQKWNMSVDFLFGSSEILSTNDFDVKISCVDIDLEYSLLARRFTPLIIAGIGSVTFSDSFTSVEKLNETDFSYNFAAGIKWNVAGNIFIKPFYRATFTKIKYSSNSIVFHGINITIGYLFHINT